MTQKTPPDVIFLLGAGASVKAGVPDTYQLVTGFQSHLRSDSGLNDVVAAVERILKILGEWQASQKETDDRIDVELLLDALESLRTRRENYLLKFFENPKYIIEGYPEKGLIIERLRNFIKSEAIVDRTKISYLDQLRTFLDYSPLDVFSVNYDTVIEQFCVVHKLQLTDGFESRWEPQSFDTNTSGLRLYKLHGSITWYKTDLGDYVKVPILAQKDEIELVTGERAKSLILYPANKWEFDEPLLELLMLFKKRLATAKVCIVVGYSFRDEHITRIFWDAARQNRELNLILISPSATEIYRTKLKF